MKETRLLPETEGFLLRRFLPDGTRIIKPLQALTIGEEVFFEGRFGYRGVEVAVNYSPKGSQFSAMVVHVPSHVTENEFDCVDFAVALMNEHRTDIEVRLENEILS